MKERRIEMLKKRNMQSLLIKRTKMKSTMGEGRCLAWRMGVLEARKVKEIERLIKFQVKNKLGKDRRPTKLRQ